MDISIKDIIELATSKSASDIHISSNERVAIRVDGEIKFVEEFGILSPEQVDLLKNEMINPSDMPQNERKEIDFTFALDNDQKFRCNAFERKGMPSLSMRLIQKSIKSFEEIGLPEKLKELLLKKQGLILISGPAGNGKSTTMAAILDWISENRSDHIITIEDPIEHHLENKKSLVSQREIHRDTKSFEDSLRAALRQDPNVIAIGEMRDRETIESVLKLSSTGHLVISTVHASSVSQTIYRILSAFPQEQHSMILSQLAESLLSILSQRLVKNVDGQQLAVFEFMLSNFAIKNALRNGDMPQLEFSIETGMTEGMFTLKQHVTQLVQMGVLNESILETHF